MSDSAVERAKAAWRARPHGALPPGPPDGTSGDMEVRVKNLEADVRELKADMKTVLVDVAVLKERVGHLPTKGWAFTVAAGVVAFMAALVTLAPKLQLLTGVAHP